MKKRLLRRMVAWILGILLVHAMAFLMVRATRGGPFDPNATNPYDPDDPNNPDHDDGNDAEKPSPQARDDEVNNPADLDTTTPPPTRAHDRTVLNAHGQGRAFAPMVPGT